MTQDARVSDTHTQNEAPSLEEISARLRKNREILEQDMDDSATKINAAELLERVEALRKRMEASQRTFGNVARA